MLSEGMPSENLVVAEMERPPECSSCQRELEGLEEELVERTRERSWLSVERPLNVKTEGLDVIVKGRMLAADALQGLEIDDN